MSVVRGDAVFIAVEVPTSVFGVEAAKRAAYVLMRRLTVTFVDSPSGVTCHLQSTAAPAESAALLERDFRRELLDQELRISIEQRTQPLRDAILGLAFSRTGLQT